MFNSSRVAPDGVELQERHRPLRPVRVANALTKQFVVVTGTWPPRPQALRDVSSDGSVTDRAAEHGDDGETTAVAQGGTIASGSQHAVAANEAVQETRHEGEHVIPPMERSTPGISFAAGSVESGFVRGRVLCMLSQLVYLSSFIVRTDVKTFTNSCRGMDTRCSGCRYVFGKMDWRTMWMWILMNSWLTACGDY